MIVNCFLPSFFSEMEKNAQTRSKTIYHVSNAVVICFSKNAVSGIIAGIGAATFLGCGSPLPLSMVPDWWLRGNTISEVLEEDKFFWDLTWDLT